MNTLEELVDYCTVPVSMGALVLTGGWGSGKTYFIENDLKNALKDTHVLLRISLYTYKTIDLVNEEIRRQWLYAVSPFYDSLEKHEDEIKNGKELLESSVDAMSAIQPMVKGVKAAAAVSESVLKSFPIRRQIKTKNGTREVVLVFDDLERTQINMSDVMGCINNYCEDRHFKVIIVTCEARIGGMDSPLMSGRNSQKVYYNLKEKTIARTVCFKPDAALIIHSILEDSELFGENYRQFLLKNESLVNSVPSVFSVQADTAYREAEDQQGGAQIITGDNFRILKCALHDFERIYEYLYERDMDSVERYLYHFLVYTVADRSGLISRDQNGLMRSDEAVRKLCPRFDDRYLPVAIKKWILYGEWDEEDIWKEEWLLYRQKEQITPRERLRTMNILEWEETDISDGYGELLRDGYAGKLTVNEYVTLIHNSRRIRQLGTQMPLDIDWRQMTEGIRKRLRDGGQETNEYRDYQEIKSRQRDEYSPEELAAYDLIDAGSRRSSIDQENAREQFLRIIREQGVRAFVLCGNIPTGGFDAEMARAVARCFDESHQAIKLRFPVFFHDYWEKRVRQVGIDPATERDGLSILLTELEALKKRYRQDGRFIAVKHTDTMIGELEKLMAIPRGENIERENSRQKKTGLPKKEAGIGSLRFELQKPGLLRDVAETLKKSVSADNK